MSGNLLEMIHAHARKKMDHLWVVILQKHCSDSIHPPALACGIVLCCIFVCVFKPRGWGRVEFHHLFLSASHYPHCWHSLVNWWVAWRGSPCTVTGISGKGSCIRPAIVNRLIVCFSERSRNRSRTTLPFSGVHMWLQRCVLYSQVSNQSSTVLSFLPRLWRLNTPGLVNREQYVNALSGRETIHAMYTPRA